MNKTELNAIKFAEYVAENHYRLYNILDGVYIWRNESQNKTTEELYEDYKKEVTYAST